MRDAAAKKRARGGGGEEKKGEKSQKLGAWPRRQSALERRPMFVRATRNYRWTASLLTVQLRQLVPPARLLFSTWLVPEQFCCLPTSTSIPPPRALQHCKPHRVVHDRRLGDYRWPAVKLMRSRYGFPDIDGAAREVATSFSAFEIAAREVATSFSAFEIVIGGARPPQPLPWKI
ncbi:hypothetical protein MRX96_006924 [Rhipicephalus microplus]